MTVRTRVKRLEERVEALEVETDKDVKETGYWWEENPSHSPTLSGKIDAIIEYLGIEIDVKQASEPQVKVSKVKKGKK